MTDLRRDDAAFERALRATLEDLAPDAAPAILRAAVSAMPLGSRRGKAARGRALFAAVGLAAAVVIGLAGVAMLARPNVPTGPLSPAGSTPAASPTPTTETFTFRVVGPDGTTASKAQVDEVGAVMAARLRAYGIGTFSWSASDDRITFELDLPPDARSLEAVRSLLGTTGVFSIGQPVVTPLEPGDRVVGRPLIAGDDVADARTGSDQTGNPSLDLTFDEPAATALAEATATHIGEYIPVALDGVAVVVPVIMAEIPGGQLQVSFASDDATTAPRLAAILQAGPLPLPVEAVAP